MAEESETIRSRTHVMECATCRQTRFEQRSPYDWRCANCNDSHVRFVPVPQDGRP